MVDSIGMFKQKHGKGDKDEENDKNITKQKDVSSFDWYDQAKARATLLAAARKEPERGIFSTLPLGFSLPLGRKGLSTQIIFCCY